MSDLVRLKTTREQVEDARKRIADLEEEREWAKIEYHKRITNIDLQITREQKKIARLQHKRQPAWRLDDE